MTESCGCGCGVFAQRTCVPSPAVLTATSQYLHAFRVSSPTRSLTLPPHPTPCYPPQLDRPPSLPPIYEMARPELKLAGVRLDPELYARSKMSYYTGGREGGGGQACMEAGVKEEGQGGQGNGQGGPRICCF